MFFLRARSTAATGVFISEIYLFLVRYHTADDSSILIGVSFDLSRVKRSFNTLQYNTHEQRARCYFESLPFTPVVNELEIEMGMLLMPAFDTKNITADGFFCRLHHRPLQRQGPDGRHRPSRPVPLIPRARRFVGSRILPLGWRGGGMRMLRTAVAHLKFLRRLFCEALYPNQQPT